MRDQLALFAYRYFPNVVKEWLGANKSLRWLRKTILLEHGRSRVATGMVQFENRAFQFTAPYRTLVKAQTNGIENRICRAILANVPEGGVCVDVGANCGYVTLVMASTVGERGKVISFEPNQFFGEIVTRNIKQNGFELSTTVDPRPAGRAEGAEFHKDIGSGLNFTTLTTRIRESGVTRVDMIKVDVDGGDFDVLVGGDEVIRQYRPFLIVEMTDNQAEIFAYLRDLRYQHIVGMNGEVATRSAWPANIFAWDQEIKFPPRGGCV